jgi:hypothetical protein
MVGSFWFWHWYLLWVVVLAALVPTSRFTTTALPACCAGVLWCFIAADFLIRRGRPATAITPADGLGAIIWIGLVVGALGLVALWRALRLTNRVGNLAAPLWRPHGLHYVHDQQLAGTPAEQPE